MKITVLNALVVMCWCAIRTLALPDVILIGGIFDSQDQQQEMAFRYAVERVNNDNTLLPRSRLEHRSINLPNDDSFHAAKKVCELLREGVAAIFGPQTENTANHIQSICDAMEIPHIETRWHYTDRRDAYSINLHPYPPSLGQVYKDILKKLDWKKFVILYDDNESLVRMQSILKESSWEYLVRKLPVGNDYRPLLKDIKLSGYKHILLDVSQDKIFRVLDHAGLVGLMTDYQRYFITNLDLNQVDLERFKGSGTNITGIQLVDQKAHKTKTLVENWKRGELRFNYHLPDFNTITTDAALIFDAVILFASALTELENVKNVDISQLYCESDKTWQHGSTLVNYMKLYSSPAAPVTHRSPAHPRSQSPVVPPNWETRWSPRRGGGMGTTGSGMRGGGGYFGGQNLSTVHRPIMGLSGLIKFNEEGFRSDFTLDILEMEQGDLKKVGKWSKGDGAYFTRAFVETQERVETSLKDRNRVVCTALTKPYAMEKESSETLTGNDKYEGFCIDLIDKIARMYQFNYTIMVTPDGAYGSKDAKGNWNGIVKQLIDNKADLGIVDFTITYQREAAVDFTMPFMNLGISIIYKKPMKKSPSLFSFMSPFSVDVWIYMATAYLGVSVLLFILARMTPEEWTNPLPCITDPEELENCFTLVNSLWFVIATFLCQGADIAPRAVSTRIVAGIWWFFTLIMISSYTANLAAFLTVERMDSPIESAEDLAKQTKIKYGLKEGGSTYAFFQESSYDTYKKMWQTMSTQRPSVFTSNNDLGVERVKKSNGLYAFLMESVSIEYVVERNCDLMRIGDLLDSKSYGIALRPGSPYTSVISSAILMLKENGTLHELKEYWWKKKKTTDGETCQEEEEKDPASAAELGLDNVGGVFVVMVGGIALACLTACCEFIWKARKLATDEGMSFRTELRKELLFVINCRENSKPVRKRALPASTDSSSIYGSSNYGYSGNGKN